MRRGFVRCEHNIGGVGFAYRGTSLTRKWHPLGPYGGGCFLVSEAPLWLGQDAFPGNSDLEPAEVYRGTLLIIKRPILGPPQGPGYRPAAGSQGVACYYERGAPVLKRGRRFDDSHEAATTTLSL